MGIALLLGAAFIMPLLARKKRELAGIGNFYDFTPYNFS
jgi:hypothetical protein